MKLRAWLSRLRGSLRRDEGIDHEMEEEMAFHLEMSARRNLGRGMPPHTATRAARVAFGSADAFREGGRDAQRARFLENLVADVRYALRGLRRSPAFATAAILTVALGIGASTSIFSVVNAVFLRPLPIPQPQDFTYLGWQWSDGNTIPSLTSFQFEFLRDHNGAFEAVAAYGTQEAFLGEEGTAQPIRGLRVSGGFLRTMGYEPRLGRAFDGPELETGGPPVVILGEATWRTRFGADPAIVGRAVRLNGETRTVLGVLPADFRFPPSPGNLDYLVPLPVQADPADEGHNTEAIARWRSGTSTSLREDELLRLSAAFRDSYPALAPAGASFKVFSHDEVFAGSIQRTLWLLFGAVSLLLLIGCANTATLLLVRSSVRQREMAVRASIGAGLGRILQQLLTEGLVLSAIATLFGVLLGIVGLRGFLAVSPLALPPGADPHVDGTVLAYAVAMSVATGLVFGLAAAVPSFRVRLQSVLAGSARGSTGGGNRTREALVFVETTAAVVLLAGAALLTASFGRLLRVDPGFDAERVIAVRLGRLPPGYDVARRSQLVERLLTRLRALPGVEYVAAAPNLPLERGRNFPVDTPEHPERGIGATELRFVTSDYFATLGTRLLAGRDFDRGDVAGAEPVAIVNQTFARRFWGDSTPVGRTIRVGHFRDRWLNPSLDHGTRVIGVAEDMHEIGLDREPRPTVLLPRAQASDGTPVLLVRGQWSALAPVLRAAVLAEDRQISPTVERLSSVVHRSVAAPRFRALLIGAFGCSALLLAGIGIYGVIASVVQMRTREIGLRLALGATRASVAVTVVRRCLTWVAAGVLAGLLIFWPVRRLLDSMVYDMSTADPRVLAGAVGMLMLVAAIAAWVPARRATRVDPALSLRLE